MIIPFSPEDLFELNTQLSPQFNNGVIIIDNIFKNYEKILEVCNNLSVEQWKHTPTSRNFKDYYDCRPIFANHHPNTEKVNYRKSIIFSLVKHYYNIDYELNFQSHFTFNYFKHLNKNVSKNYQHHPHYDMDFNVIFYIDPFENGGTAIYENIKLNNNEHENLLIDISSFNIKHIIKSKPNRCVIFPGYNLHGGYIENHNTYYYNWRINIANFLSKSND